MYASLRKSAYIPELLNENVIAEATKIKGHNSKRQRSRNQVLKEDPPRQTHHEVCVGPTIAGVAVSCAVSVGSTYPAAPALISTSLSFFPPFNSFP